MGILAYSDFDTTFANKPLHHGTIAAGSDVWHAAYLSAVSYVQSALANGTPNLDPVEFADAVQYLVDFGKINSDSASSLATSVGLQNYAGTLHGRFVTGLTPLLLWWGDATTIDQLMRNLPPSGSYIAPLPASLIDFMKQQSQTIYGNTRIYWQEATQYAINNKIDIDPQSLQSYYSLYPTPDTAQSWIATRLHAESDATTFLANPALRRLLEFYLLSPGMWQGPRIPGFSTQTTPDAGDLGGPDFTVHGLTGGAYLLTSLLMRQAQSGTVPDDYFMQKLDTISADGAALVRYTYLNHELAQGQDFNQAFLASLTDYDSANNTVHASTLIETQCANYLQTKNRLVVDGVTTDDCTIYVSRQQSTVRVYLDQMGADRPPAAGDTVFIGGKVGAGVEQEAGHSIPLTDADISRGYVDVSITVPEGAIDISTTYTLRSSFGSGVFISPSSQPLAITLLPNLPPPSLSGANQWMRYDRNSDVTFVTFDMDWTGEPITSVDASKFSVLLDAWYDAGGGGIYLLQKMSPWSVNYNAQTGKVQVTVGLSGDWTHNVSPTNPPGTLTLTIGAGAVSSKRGSSDASTHAWTGPDLPTNTPQPFPLLLQNTDVPALSASARKWHYADRPSLEMLKSIDPQRGAYWEQAFKNAGEYQAPAPAPPRRVFDYALQNCWISVQPIVRAAIDKLNEGMSTTNANTALIQQMNNCTSALTGLQALIGASTASDVTLLKSPAGDSQFDRFCGAYQQYFDASNDNPLNLAVVDGSISEANPNGLLTPPTDVTFGQLVSTITSASNRVTTLGNQGQVEALNNQTNLQNMNAACKALAEMIALLSEMMSAIWR